MTEEDSRSTEARKTSIKKAPRIRNMLNPQLQRELWTGATIGGLRKQRVSPQSQKMSTEGHSGGRDAQHDHRHARRFDHNDPIKSTHNPQRTKRGSAH